MFRKRYIAAVILLLILGPVVIRQVFPSEPRQYSGVTLDEVQYAEVTFRNEAQNLDLAGMLFTPDGDGPFRSAAGDGGDPAGQGGVQGARNGGLAEESGC